ncbi:hypothetical protein IGB42_03854 [Andreprevotia sp. IGB-42]|uniref:esterase-like activity of phytase family protein n=1 Tax=Andreprevotia sp. IGB-42 TaxID=2497473 RepID=UPI00135CB2B1|nr:esterase-like activity of phytase family protein [Andreprevotia sp. IGB-42]KAF0811696.1 hypothetical protein IGB42_03854 [Andreprevotia sp. IGB-42]
MSVHRSALRLSACLSALLLSSALLQAAHAAPPIASLRLIGTRTIANDLYVDGTLVGGLSGIDYDRATDRWLLISDDRSDQAPARFYTAQLRYDRSGFTQVEVRKATTLLQADDQPYPDRNTGGVVPDPESLRIDPQTHDIWWTSEGDRTLALDPFIARSDQQGKLIETLPLPAMLGTRRGAGQGARNNLALEGLSFSTDAQSLWAAMEGPLYEDGAPPTPQTGAMARFTRIDRAGKVLAQYAYPLDPIPAAPAPGKAADNGVSEVLASGNDTVLVIERAGVQLADNRYVNHIRLYEADAASASDISAVTALPGARYQAMRKRLVLDLNTLGLPRLDNIEGLSWGRTLGNGNRSLVMVSDNNFNPGQITQLLVFEVLPQ